MAGNSIEAFGRIMAQMQTISERFGDLEFRANMGELSPIAELGWQRIGAKGIQIGQPRQLPPDPMDSSAVKDANPNILPWVYGVYIPPRVRRAEHETAKRRLNLPKLKRDQIGVHHKAAGMKEVVPHELKHSGMTDVKAFTPGVPPRYEELMVRASDMMDADPKDVPDLWEKLKKASPSIETIYKTPEGFMQAMKPEVDRHTHTAKRILTELYNSKKFMQDIK